MVELHTLNALDILIEEVILSLIIIDFVNNYIYSLLIYTFEDNNPNICEDIYIYQSPSQRI
jgi:hypothetical protein